MFLRVDLLKVIIGLDSIKLKDTFYFVLADFDMTPLSWEKTFDIKTIDNLMKFDLVLSSPVTPGKGYENGFHIFAAHNPNNLKLIHDILVLNNIAAILEIGEEQVKFDAGKPYNRGFGLGSPPGSFPPDVVVPFIPRDYYEWDPKTPASRRGRPIAPAEFVFASYQWLFSAMKVEYKDYPVKDLEGVLPEAGTDYTDMGVLIRSSTIRIKKEFSFLSEEQASAIVKIFSGEYEPAKEALVLVGTRVKEFEEKYLRNESYKDKIDFLYDSQTIRNIFNAPVIVTDTSKYEDLMELPFSKWEKLTKKDLKETYELVLSHKGYGDFLQNISKYKEAKR
jgi:hypothetical protein